MVESSASVTQLYSQAILQAAQRRNLQIPQSILEQVRPQERVPLQVQDQLWEYYCHHSGDALAGLELGLGIEIGHLDSAGMLLVSCDTLLEGVETLIDYAPVIGDGGVFELVNENGLLGVCYQPAYQLRVGERVEAVMASLLKLTRWATGQAFIPSEIRFSHSPLSSPHVYEQRLDVEVQFNMHRNGLYFAATQGDLPLIQANSQLRAHLQKLADKTMATLGQQCLSTQITQVVNANPSWGRERVASALAVSGRHMNRLLAKEGLSFKILRERELHRMAKIWLKQGKTILEIAEKLGFSEKTALVRAFRRWEGESPARYRARFTL